MDFGLNTKNPSRNSAGIFLLKICGFVSLPKKKTLLLSLNLDAEFLVLNVCDSCLQFSVKYSVQGL